MSELKYVCILKIFPETDSWILEYWISKLASTSSCDHKSVKDLIFVNQTEKTRSSLQRLLYIADINWIFF